MTPLVRACGLYQMSVHVLAGFLVLALMWCDPLRLLHIYTSSRPVQAVESAEAHPRAFCHAEAARTGNPHAAVGKCINDP